MKMMKVMKAEKKAILHGTFMFFMVQYLSPEQELNPCRGKTFSGIRYGKNPFI